MREGLLEGGAGRGSPDAFLWTGGSLRNGSVQVMTEESNL